MKIRTAYDLYSYAGIVAVSTKLHRLVIGDDVLKWYKQHPEYMVTQ